ncbi:MAG: TolC family protein [Bacteriovorax sp.]
MEAYDKIRLPLLIGGLLMVSAVRAEIFYENNLEVMSAQTKIKTLKLEKKIERSLFLPEFSLNTGLGSEKLNDFGELKKEEGPYLFLEGKLNLYRGGRDQSSLEKTDIQIQMATLEKEIKKRNLNIESMKKFLELELLSKENQLLEDELKTNSNEQLMARKKVDAGLTTSADLIDFDLKATALQNDLEKNQLKRQTIEKELVNLYGGLTSLEAILKNEKEASIAMALGDKIKFSESLQWLLERKQRELIALEKKSTQSEYLPSIDLEAKWGQITPQRRFLEPEREHQIALNISIPLFSGWSTEGKLEQTDLESTLKTRQLRQTELDQEAKVELELKKMALLKKILTSLERSLTQSVKYRELTINEYKRGIKNSPDVISASDKRLEVERKILETKNELLSTTYSLNETFKAYQGDL